MTKLNIFAVDKTRHLDIIWGFGKHINYTTACYRSNNQEIIEKIITT